MATMLLIAMIMILLLMETITTLLLMAMITILLLMATMRETFDHELRNLIGFSEKNQCTLTPCPVVNHTQILT